MAASVPAVSSTQPPSTSTLHPPPSVHPSDTEHDADEGVLGPRDEGPNDADEEDHEEVDTRAGGHIKTEPNAKIVYNAPFSEKNVYNVRLTNNGAHRIGWAIKTTNMKRLAVDPPFGCLDSKEVQMLTIACEPFTFGAEDTNNDRISFEWTNAPLGVVAFGIGWFLRRPNRQKKILAVEYNP